MDFAPGCTRRTVVLDRKSETDRIAGVVRATGIGALTDQVRLAYRAIPSMIIKVFPVAVILQGFDLKVAADI